jgi:hypothetical protein
MNNTVKYSIAAVAALLMGFFVAQSNRSAGSDFADEVRKEMKNLE